MKCSFYDPVVVSERHETWRSFLRAVASIADQGANHPDPQVTLTALDILTYKLCGQMDLRTWERSLETDWRLAFRNLIECADPCSGSEVARLLEKLESRGLEADHD